jgi:mRNA interferase MazF
MVTKPFEIYLAYLNPEKGHEVGKTRPFVVVHSELMQGILSTSIVCPLTTQLSTATLLRVHIPINESRTTGLTEPSDVIVDQIRSIDNQRLIKKLGELPSAQAEQLQKNLQTILAV